MKAKKSANPSGFALVATLMLMLLLGLLAVGMLSLSSISMRSTSQSSALSIARGNARMALMVAIGELQKQMGPDQRISSNANTLDDPDTPLNEVLNPHWTGVWNSWTASMDPVSPDNPGGPSAHQTIQGVSDVGIAPTYLAKRSDYFRTWLLSLDPSEAKNISSPIDLVLDGSSAPTGTDTAIRLVGEGSLGVAASAEDYVSARLLSVTDPSDPTKATGRYGWWVGDESQKARIMADSYTSEPAITDAGKIYSTQAPGSMGNVTAPGLGGMIDEQQLDGLASHKTLDLVSVNPEPAGNDPKISQMNFHTATIHSSGVLADVREGGLKRDLSALLERKIDPAEVDADPSIFSLYKFNTKDSWASAVGSTSPQECVPIQDLAAYYQLYDAVSPEAEDQDDLRISNSRGVRYAAHPSLGGINGMHLLSTDFGTTASSPIYPTAYSSIYTHPRIIKIQFLATLSSQRINPPIPSDRNNPTPNTHELLIGITPAITFWNPTNLPVVFQMNSNPALGAQMLRFRETPIQIRFNKNNGQHITNYASFAYLNESGSQMNEMFNLYWAGIHPISLEPGEVKTLSLPFSGDLSNLKSTHGYNGHWAGSNDQFFFKTDTWYVGHEVKVGWEPESFINSNNSAIAGPNNGPTPVGITATDVRHVVNGRLRFKSADRIQVDIGSGGSTPMGWMNNSSSYQDYNAATSNWGRANSKVGIIEGATAVYQPLLRRGMPGGAANLVSSSRSGSAIIARSSTEAGWPFMHFGMMAGVETAAGGRKFAGRPFLHSSTLHSYPFLDENTGNALYNFGWNWTVDLINDVYEAPVQVTSTGSSYWGGGYTPTHGTTHIIQQEIPVAPPISIAALSHARLGGWSISDQDALTYSELGQPNSTRRENLSRAVGFGGLRPHVLQAIGNSYAHPQIPADKAFTTVSRTYNTADGSFSETFADHSYLANKALWDDFFFSSITPQRSEVKVFGSSDLEAEDVANGFFFGSESLPNRRIKPYLSDMDESKLTELFAQKDTFTDGLADKIAANLTVEGPFNINSTSVEAWKIFFSSLKAKPVAYLEGSAAMSGSAPSLATGHAGTPVGQMGLAGGAPYSGSPDDPREANQWTSWRELTDTEIQELATAMVKQVKLRGPFLSLSDFVNRRLDADNTELAVKGALQAALDDPDVSINEAFRANGREFSSSDLASMNPAFPLAAEGPVAYGSAAYVDQADILRSFAEQITPRGDTFVIRTYGDSLDAQGNVLARAWCEAVVQRVPDYVDSSDEPHIKSVVLTSESNKIFGRKLQIVSFRWLGSSEV